MAKFMLDLKSETIVALASGPGLGGVAVIRLSGPEAHTAITALGVKTLPSPRMARLAALYHPMNQALLDKALILIFAGPKSFTGENCAEIQCHGGPQIITSIIDALLETGLCRLALEGEFTRRAFENGKLDLTEAEGLNDLIHARTPKQQSLALKQMDGALRHLYENWRERLLGHLAHLEADIEFPDEDLPDGISGALSPPLHALLTEIEAHLADNGRGQAIRDGYRIALVGAPNAGKSTLLNALAKSDIAIVTDVEGTTRDIIEHQMIIGGYLVRLMDMAGIRESNDPIEQEGIRRALKGATDANHCLILCPFNEALSDELRPLLGNATLVRTKSDLLPDSSTETVFHVKQDDSSSSTMLSEEVIAPVQSLSLSAKTGDGVSNLISVLERQIAEDLQDSETPLLTRRRHRTALQALVDHLQRSLEMLPVDDVLAAEDLRLATRALGSITGRVDVEDMLDRVFNDFCIGK